MSMVFSTDWPQATPAPVDKATECETPGSEHVPGLVFAPVFGLPGPRSSVCETCGRAIERRGQGERWVTK